MPTSRAKRKAKPQTPENSLKAEISKLVNRIHAIDTTHLFLHDPVAQFPAIAEPYKLVCPNRMWIQKMRSKNQALEYTQLADWLSDFELMIKNCLLFNAQLPAYSQEAQRVYKEAIAYIQPVQDRLGVASAASEARSAGNSPAGQQTAPETAGLAEDTPPAVEQALDCHEAPVDPAGLDAVSLPPALHDFLVQQDADMKATGANSENPSDFPQCRRKHSVKMILCFFSVEARWPDTVKQILESILRLFDTVADGLLLYPGEREGFTMGLSGKAPAVWSETVGVDVFLRFAFHFRAIAGAAGWLPGEMQTCCQVLREVLGFIDTYFTEICEAAGEGDE